MYLVVFLNVIIHGCLTGSRVVLSLFAIDLGVNALQIGLMVALYSATPLMLGVTAGRITDRYGVQPPMLFGAVLCACGLLLPYLWQHVGALYLSAIVIGTGFVFYNGAVQNLTGAWGPRADRGYVIEYFSHARAYLCLALSMLVAIAILLGSRSIRAVETPHATEHTQSAFSLLRTPELRKVLITSAMIVTGWDLYMFYLPIYGHSIGLSPSTIGIILGMFAIATFVVRFWLPQLNARFEARRVLAVSMFFGAAVFVVFPFAHNAWLIGVLSFGIGLALGSGQPIPLLMSYNRSPEGRTGEVTGVRMTLNHFTHTVVPVVAGGLGAAFGMAPVFVMIAAVLGVSGYLSSTVKRAGPTPPPA